VRVRFGYQKLLRDFQTVTVEKEDFEVLDEIREQYEVVETEDPVSTQESHVVAGNPIPIKILHWLFGAGLVGLLIASPLSGLLGIDPANGMGIFVMILFAVTLFIGSNYKKHNEVLLSQLPWTTLFFIIFLFGIAHGLEVTGVTDVIAEQLFVMFGANQILLRLVIVIVAAVVTAIMDNVIAIAVVAPVILALGDKGLETTGLWFTLLAVAVVAGNLTPIGSAANIIANARIRASWGQWWQTAGVLALECLAINVVALYVWELLIAKI